MNIDYLIQIFCCENIDLYNKNRDICKRVTAELRQKYFFVYQNYSSKDKIIITSY